MGVVVLSVYVSLIIDKLIKVLKVKCILHIPYDNTDHAYQIL